ncbi:MAG: tRNA pseudouridine(55) synthase TruB [Clostridia bacterium]|nr:tRNA pseudouridine(55) synthase TruB [Clostridia bacterium]
MGWQNNALNGILLLDKPSGFTSMDVCAVVRGMLHTKKVGHSGTLDPMATGVLPILIGSATRALDLIPSHDKTYVACFRLGMTTDTLDITGSVLTECKPVVPESALREALEAFRGEIMQVPPMYSAVSVGGKKLYDLAREGVEVEREARLVTVYRLTLDSYDPESASGVLTVSCSKGTYIRTLIDDIGKALGCGAVLTSLRRTEASGISIERCMTLAQAQKYKDNGGLEDHLIPVDRIFEPYPALYISGNQAVRFCNGATLALERLQPPVIGGVRQQERLNDEKYPQDSLYRVYSSEDNAFLGLGVKKTDELRVCKRF